MADKPEWERLIDDSYDWHIAHRVIWFMMLAVVALAIWKGFELIALNALLFPFYVGFTWQESRLVAKSIKAAAAAAAAEKERQQ